MADQVAPWLPSALVARQVPGVDLDPEGALPLEVEDARVAAAAWVERQRRDLVGGVDGATFTPGADVVLGAAMLAARWHARKGSPQGLVGFAEFGPAAVLREDPDVFRMLGLGRYARPQVG